MAAVLHNGDYVPDGIGGFEKKNGVQGILCEALFRLSMKRGSFPLLPELGSRLYLVGREKPSARNMAARQYAMEALEGLDVTVLDAVVTLASDGVANIKVTLSAEGETMDLEVTA